jgi:hypothetical protein
MAEIRASRTAAAAGFGRLPGQVRRVADPFKHLGPPPHRPIDLGSPLFSTRCGLGAGDGVWWGCSDADDVWCPGCLSQALIPHRVEQVVRDEAGEASAP